MDNRRKRTVFRPRLKWVMPIGSTHGGCSLVDWFRRFGDIPGVTLAAAPDLDPRTLPGYGAVPEVHVFEFEGRRRETLMWPASDGGISTSPANRLTFADLRNVTAAEFLRRSVSCLISVARSADFDPIEGSSKRGSSLAVVSRRSRRASPLRIPPVIHHRERFVFDATAARRRPCSSLPRSARPARPE